MSAFWQTMIPAVLTALVAGRVALTRTSRLRRTIDANLALLDRLPADHPNRATMEDHNGERWTCWFAGSSDGLGRSPRLGSPLASSPA